MMIAKLPTDIAAMKCISNWQSSKDNYRFRSAT